MKILPVEQAFTGKSPVVNLDTAAAKAFILMTDRRWWHRVGG